MNKSRQLAGPGQEAISPGDIYEDVFFHPCLCIGVEQGAAWGISLIEGSQPRTVDLVSVAFAS